MAVEGLVVTGVVPNSIADELGIVPGNRILEINKQPVRDIIDYRFLTCDEELIVKIIDNDNEQWTLEIEKDFDEELGLDFGAGAFGRTRRCQNKCLFCFVDQMAPNMRDTLYVKDDDYRLSFWQGNFVTLTNVNDHELQRIISQRLGPLYISVHTTNPQLRSKMMGNPKAEKIMEQLTALAGAGIEMHTQVVLCPGINDGQELESTVSDLAGIWPAVQSVAVVPVGLTRYRQDLAQLQVFTALRAKELVKQINLWQQEFLNKFDYPFIFASDEFYIMAGLPFPPDESYADYPQTENGVGLARLFLDKWSEREEQLPRFISTPREVTVVTGSSANEILKPVVKRLNQIENLTVNLKRVPHRFFGESVTVAGLLTGSDILAELKGQYLGDSLIIPATMLKNQEEHVFLDDVTVVELSRQLGVEVMPAEDPGDLIASILKD